MLQVFSGQEVHKLAPLDQNKKMLPMGHFYLYQEYIFNNFKVLTCNSNKQQAVEDRVLDIIRRLIILLLALLNTTSSQTQRKQQC